MSPNLDEARDERLAGVLAEALEALRSHGSLEIETWKSRYPEYATELADLLDTLCSFDAALAGCASGFSQETVEFASTEASTDVRIPLFEGEAPMPAQIGRFRIVQRLGAGGMGAVYKAHDSQLHRLVAIKVPRFQGSPVQRQHLQQRFLREARAAAALKHRHVCPIHDVGEHSGLPYIVMQFVEGRSLAERLQEIGRFEDCRQAVVLVREVAEALAVVHAAGIVHRDLKPGNILLDAEGQAVLTDFGLSRPEFDVEHLTADGTLVGTPAYMAPEHAAPRLGPVGPRTDLYSLGVVLYQMLTGRLPFEGQGLALVYRIAEESPEPPSRLRPDLDPALEAIVLRAMARRPEDRFGSASQMAAALNGWLGSPPPLTEAASTVAPEHSTAQTALRPVRDVAPPVPPASPRRRLLAVITPRRRQWLMQGALAMGLLVGGLVLWQAGINKNTEKPPTMSYSDNALEPKAKSEQHQAEYAKALAEAQKALAEKQYEMALAALTRAEGTIVVDKQKAEKLRRQVLEAREEQRRLAYQQAMQTGRQALMAKKYDEAVRAFQMALSLNPSDPGALASLKTTQGAMSSVAPKTRQDEYKLVMQAGRDAAQKQDLPRAITAFREALRLRPDDPEARGGLLAGHAAQSFLDAFTLRAQASRERMGPISLVGHSAAVSSACFSPDGQRIVSGSDDKTVRIWDARAGEEVRSLKGHADRVSSVSFSPDGKRVASVSADRTVKIWDANTGQEVLTLRGHTNKVTSVSISPDGKRLATASLDGTAKVWDAETGQEIYSLRVPRSGSEDRLAPVSVCFAPDGKHIVTGGGGQAVTVWDSRTGQEVLSLKGEGGISSVSFSPDSKRIACAGWDKTVQVCDAQTGQKIVSLKGHGKSVTSASFSPDGKQLASASKDGTVKVWDAVKGTEIRSFKGRSPVSSVSWSSDGKSIATANEDGTLSIYRVDSPAPPDSGKE